jgi:hypothetical protein
MGLPLNLQPLVGDQKLRPLGNGFCLTNDSMLGIAVRSVRADD